MTLLFTLAGMSSKYSLQKRTNKQFMAERVKKLIIPFLFGLFVPEWLMLYVLNIGGKSIGQFFFLYMVGYFILSKEDMEQEVRNYRFVSLTLALLSGTAYTYLYCFAQLRNEFGTGLYVFFGWTGILTLLGFGQTILNVRNQISRYFARASYPVYIMHQTVLVIIAYWVLKLPVGIWGQYFLIILISFAITLLLYEIIRRIPYIRGLVGISK